MATTAAAVSPPPLTAEVNPTAGDAVSPPLLTAEACPTADVSVSPQPLTAEAIPTDASSPQQELQDLSPIANQDTPHSHELETLPQSPPVFINSIAELKDLSAAIASFQQCYDDLHNHLDSIKSAILTKLPLESENVTDLPLSAQCGEKPDISELEGLCKTMCSRGVRKYLSTHLFDLSKLLEEVPKSLKLAPNSRKLVLECLGKFYLQGKKAFTRNSPMIPARDASILILECFLLMMGMDGDDSGMLEIEKAVREEAETAALAWRKRLMTEGPVSEASQADARGLLLFVACFGVPAKFRREDIRDLMIAGNAKEIVGVLRNSRVLMTKIPETVEWMIKNKLEVDAVDIVYTFGLEEKFHPQIILTSFLRESKDSWKKPKTTSQGPASLNEANKKQLSALKSIKKCLTRHKIDPAKLLPGWQINDKIASLEKDIADSNKKSTEKNKRKANEPETSKKPKPQEPKRARYSGHGPPQQKATNNHIDNRRNLLDNGRPSHHPSNNYSAPPSVVYGGPGAGLLPETMGPPGVGPGLSTGSYGGDHGGYTVDASGQIVNRASHPYAYYGGDAGLVERYSGQQPSSVGLISLYRASMAVEGFPGVANASTVGVGGGVGRRGPTSDLYQFADSVAESESYPSGVARGGGGPSGVHGHRSTYLYQV